MKNTIKKAFIATIPVLTGFLFLGMGFGIVMKANGYGILVSTMMGLAIYAGSMQFVAIGLLSTGASLITAALTTLMVNLRHLFYGISLLDKYKNVGKRKAYLIFGLTDETYSLVCTDNADIPEERKKDYYLFVTLFNHCYWVTGCFLGGVIGTLINFNSEGIDFALTALFITVFVEQWLGSKKHLPALIGLGASVLSLVIFGADGFLIPAMAIIAVSLCLYKEGEANA